MNAGAAVVWFWEMNLLLLCQPIYLRASESAEAMATRTVDDIKKGMVMRWDMSHGFSAHPEGGFILGDQVICVQNGFASQRFLENTVRLVTTCFNTNPARLSDELDRGGIAWDFIVAVHRGSDVNDVVAACILVYGQSEREGELKFEDRKRRQYLYVFNVSTHPCMARRGLAKVIMDAVYRLGCFALRDKESDYWRGLMPVFSGELWLLTEVDFRSKLVVPSDKLIKLYSGLGYTPYSYSVPITLVEPWRKRWAWCITVDPAIKRQMWMRVVQERSSEHSRWLIAGSLLEELRLSAVVIASRFERLLDEEFLLAL